MGYVEKYGRIKQKLSSGLEALLLTRNPLRTKECCFSDENENYFFNLTFSPSAVRFKLQGEVMLGDTLAIICISVFTAFLGEGITWLLVYRTDKYKKLQAEVDKHSKKLEKQRDTTSENKIDKAAKKRLEKQEERLKVFMRDLNAVKIKSMFATAVIFTSFFSVCSTIFDGRVVCKLPFTPISWLYGMSHRNLHGSDFTDCSFIFLYIICTMSIRQNVQKMLGFCPSRAANQNAYGSSS